MTAAGNRSFVGAFGVLLFVIAILFVFDLFLARVERQETRSHAAALAAQGLAHMQRGEYSDAVKGFGEAVAEERENRGYQRQLAEALIAAGRTNDARSVLEELLQSDQTDGTSNLFMGRLLVHEGSVSEGISYYHRAVYGKWAQDAVAQRLAVRFELIDLLAKREMKEDLLAELLPVQDSVTSREERLRVGQFFLAADSPNRAADLFHSVLEEDPEDTHSLSGLGRAEFARGNYRAARRYLEHAARNGTSDPAAKSLLDTVDALFHLDPTLRGLGPEEKLRRSQEVLRQVAELTSKCSGERELLDAASKRLSAKVRRAEHLEVAEADLDLAERLWLEAKKGCRPVPEAKMPLAVVVRRFGQ